MESDKRLIALLQLLASCRTCNRGWVFCKEIKEMCSKSTVSRTSWTTCPYFTASSSSGGGWNDFFEENHVSCHEKRYHEDVGVVVGVFDMTVTFRSTRAFKWMTGDQTSEPIVGSLMHVFRGQPITLHSWSRETGKWRNAAPQSVSMLTYILSR